MELNYCRWRCSPPWYHYANASNEGRILSSGLLHPLSTYTWDLHKVIPSRNSVEEHPG